MEHNRVGTPEHMRLLLAFDAAYESLAAVALCSFLAHNSIERVVVVTPPATSLVSLAVITAHFQTPLEQITIPADAACESLSISVKGYFYCIEAIEQVCHGDLAHSPGRYLYIDADTLCVRSIAPLARLPLNDMQPMAACSHGRPMADRQLLLDLEGPYHYFNAGVLLFDSQLLARQLLSRDVVRYYIENEAICRFREQCALNAVLRGKTRYLPSQYNYLSWMRPRVTGGKWHQLSTNPMAYCLDHVREMLAIVHLSAGGIPSRLPSDKHEDVDNYWLEIDRLLHNRSSDGTMHIPTFDEFRQST